MPKVVQLQWMNGEKTTADACETIGDLRLQICTLRECIWHDVALFTSNYEALEHDEAEVPDNVFVVIKGRESLEDHTWKNSLAAHAKHEDPEGVRRVHRTLREWGLNVASIFRAVWIDECRNWNMERKMTLTAQKAGITIKREGGNCAVLRACMKGDWDTLSALLALKADVTRTNELMRTALHCAAIGGNAACVDKLLTLGTNVNQRDRNGSTALHMATSREVVQSLTAARVDINLQNHESRTALTTLVGKKFNALFDEIDKPPSSACKTSRHIRSMTTRKHDGIVSPPDNAPVISPCAQSDTSAAHICVETIGDRKRATVAALLSHKSVDLNAVGDDGRTALFFASDVRIVEMLVEANADVDICDKHGLTPLHRISKEDNDSLKNAAIAKALIAAAATVNLVDHCQQTPLHHASAVGQTAVVEVLLGAKSLNCANVQDMRGDTALHHALNSDVVALLVERGDAVVDIPSFRGYTAAHKAALKRNVSVAQALVAAKADMNICDNDGCTPVHYASMNGADIIVPILAGKANIDHRDVLGESALHKAVQWGVLCVITALLEARAVVDICDVAESTPLHVACTSERRDIVETLIRAGANLEKRKKKGCAPLHIAATSKKTDMVEVLLNAKANVNCVDDNGETPLQYAGTRAVIQILLMNGGVSKVKRRRSLARCGCLRKMLT